MKLTITLCLLAGIASAQLRNTVMAGEPAGSNLPIQKIGSNDLLAISVYDAPEFSRTARVSVDGFIRLPMVKERIPVAGLMPAEVEESIAEALTRAELIVDPVVTVTVGEYHSRPVSVMGAVRSPLTFQAVGRVALLDALARAGGLTQEAGSEILVTRHTTTGGQDTSLVQRIPVKALIDAADPAMNIPLTGDEEIRVPEAGKIFVIGNVKKPGAFVVRDSADATVLKALAVAEGLTPYAAKQAYIYRREASGSRSEIPVELRQLMDRKSQDVPLMANDILYIPDAKGTRVKLEALEKLLIVGTGATSSLIYAGLMRP